MINRLKNFKILSSSKKLTISIVGFFILYGLISLVNHYFFRTYALDLGLYNHVCWDYLHFSIDQSESFLKHPKSILNDHFDLYLIILSPLQLIFGSYALLIAQIIMVLAGGLGMYQFLQLRYGKHGLIGMIAFLSFFGVIQAFGFDYHSNVLAAMVLPWWAISIYKKQYLKSILLLFLMLIAKENIGLWLFFVCSGFAFCFKSEPTMRKNLLIQSGISAVYFVVILFWVMPFFGDGSPSQNLNFSVLGDHPSEYFTGLFKHPLEVIQAFFINHIHHPQADNLKAEFWICFLLSGGIFLLRKPVYLWMLIPIFVQKLLNDKPQFWGINHHYNIEFIPIIVLGVFETIKGLSEKTKRLVLGIWLVIVVAVTIRSIDNPYAVIHRDNMRFYQSKHYSQNFEVQPIHDFLNSIDPDIRVSAQSFIVPHVAQRKAVYIYPIVKDANMIILTKDDRTYPFDSDQMKDEFKRIESDPTWRISFENDYLKAWEKVSSEND